MQAMNKLMSRRSFEAILAGSLLTAFGAISHSDERAVFESDVVMEANNRFALNLFPILRARDASKSQFFSPFSIESALLMTLEGARGETAAEMGAALSLPARLRNDSPALPWNLAETRKSLKQLSSSLDNQDKRTEDAKKSKLTELRTELTRLNAKAAAPYSEVTNKASQSARAIAEEMNMLAKQVDQHRIKIGNAIWADKKLTLNPEFTRNLKESYGAGGAFSVDFKKQPEAQRAVINQWVSEQTEKKITELLAAGTVTSDTSLVLVNAIYFQGTWSKPFQKSDTQQRAFRQPNGSESMVSMMSNSSMDEGRYGAFNADGTPFETPDFTTEGQPASYGYPSDGFQMIDLPYNGDRIHMSILLPREDKGLDDLVRSLTYEKLQACDQAMKARRFQVKLPKFKLESNYDLNASMGQLGMKLAFDSQGRADFSGMTKANANVPVYISAIIHKAVVEVNEEGTEAAAATAVMMAPTSAAVVRKIPFVPSVVADHPFLFLIRSRANGMILFMGQYAKP